MASERTEGARPLDRAKAGSSGEQERGMSGSRPLERAMAVEEEKLLACVHCGLCLPACPTYGVLRDELDSPRGRLYLMRAASEGRIETADVIERHLSRCLGCQACETACPSGVRYGHLLEAARADLEPKARGRAGRAMMGAVFSNGRRLDAAFGALRFARESGITAALARGRRLGANEDAPAGGAGERTDARHARRDGMTKPPSALRFAAALLDATRGRLEPAASSILEDPEGPPAVLLDGCVMPRLFEPVHRAAANLLKRAGLKLVRAPKAGCCGALHAHAGLLDDARRLARRNIDAFEGARYIVTESAGCGAMMRGYGELLANDPRYAEKARAFSDRVRDLSEMLVEAAFRPGPVSVPHRIAYDAPCHLHHAQRVTEAPLELLAAVPGIALLPLADSDRCCGGAGLYNVQQRALSWSVLREKLDAIRASGAEIVVTGNPGCMMQIGAGLRLTGSRVRVHHPAEILEASWTRED